MVFTMAAMALVLNTVLVNHAEAARVSPKEKAVIELWYLSPGIAPRQPEVAIYADGTVWANGGHVDRIETDEAKVLITSLLSKDHLSQYTSEKVIASLQNASTETGLSWQIPGAGDTVIRIRTAQGNRELRCHAVGLLANRFPNLEVIQDIARAQRRLENLKAITVIGGSDQAQQLANATCVAIDLEYGVKMSIDCGDLAMVRALPDGTHYCQFLVNQSVEQSPHIVSVVRSPGQRPRVSMTSAGTLTR